MKKIVEFCLICLSTLEFFFWFFSSVLWKLGTVLMEIYMEFHMKFRALFLVDFLNILRDINWNIFPCGIFTENSIWIISYQIEFQVEFPMCFENIHKELHKGCGCSNSFKILSSLLDYLESAWNSFEFSLNLFELNENSLSKFLEFSSRIFEVVGFLSISLNSSEFKLEFWHSEFFWFFLNSYQVFISLCRIF